MLLISIAA